jgi:hypothetical protein
VDGSPNATWDGRLAYSPPQDAVQEVRVKAFDSDAAFGHTGGGTLNQVMKTGTNNLHGSLWEFNQASNLTANNFFNNKAGLGNPLTHYNQYGLTAGGPVYIPKVLNGRNKLFWFFAWEGVKDSQPNTDFTSVPTDAEKRGDFSQILKADGTQLYDPFTAVQNGTTITRSPYAGNQIPAGQLNPIAQAYLKFYPAPNVLGLPARPDGQGNYGNNNTSVDNFNNQLGRIDYNMSDRSRLFGNVRRTDYYQLKNNYFSNDSTGSILTRANWGGSLDEVFTVNSSNVLNVRFNFTRMAENHAEPSDGFNPVSLGYPAYMASNSQYLQMPFIGFSGSCGSQTSFQCLGGSGANTIPSQSTQLFGSWIHIHGSHTLKFGGDARQYRLNTFTPGNSAGTFSFTGNAWVRASSSASSTVAWGQDFASFLLGLPNGGSFDSNAFGSFYSYYVAGFIQDDWRVSRTLTVNLGLRFDHDGPYQEKYGRTVNGFGFNTENPLGAAAKAAYAKNPNAVLPVNQFDVLGGLTFASPTDRSGVREHLPPGEPARGLRLVARQIPRQDGLPRRLRHVHVAGRNLYPRHYGQLLDQPNPEPGRLQPIHRVRIDEQQQPHARQHVDQSLPERFCGSGGIGAGPIDLRRADRVVSESPNEESLLDALDLRRATGTGQEYDARSGLHRQPWRASAGSGDAGQRHPHAVPEHGAVPRS